jgi:hypothetical protein
LVTDWLISHPSASQGTGTLIYLVCALPLLGPYARWTHLQLSVIAMAALLYLISAQPESREPVHPSSEACAGTRVNSVLDEQTSLGG